jgi:hypothetical protein
MNYSAQQFFFIVSCFAEKNFTLNALLNNFYPLQLIIFVARNFSLKRTKLFLLRSPPLECGLISPRLALLRPPQAIPKSLSHNRKEFQRPKEKRKQRANSCGWTGMKETLERKEAITIWWLGFIVHWSPSVFQRTHIHLIYLLKRPSRAVARDRECLVSVK